MAKNRIDTKWCCGECGGPTVLVENSDNGDFLSYSFFLRPEELADPEGWQKYIKAFSEHWQKMRKDTAPLHRWIGP